MQAMKRLERAATPQFMIFNKQVILERLKTQFADAQNQSLAVGDLEGIFERVHAPDASARLAISIIGVRSR